MASTHTAAPTLPVGGTKSDEELARELQQSFDAEFVPASAAPSTSMPVMEPMDPDLLFAMRLQEEEMRSVMAAQGNVRTVTRQERELRDFLLEQEELNEPQPSHDDTHPSMQDYISAALIHEAEVASGVLPAGPNKQHRSSKQRKTTSSGGGAATTSSGGGGGGGAAAAASGGRTSGSESDGPRSGGKTNGNGSGVHSNRDRKSGTTRSDLPFGRQGKYAVLSDDEEDISASHKSKAVATVSGATTTAATAAVSSNTTASASTVALPSAAPSIVKSTQSSDSTSSVGHHKTTLEDDEDETNEFEIPEDTEDAGGNHHPGPTPGTTKHDLVISGRRTAKEIERRLGPMAAGDLSSLPSGLPSAAVTSLRSHSQRQFAKGHAAHGRVAEEDYATEQSVLDQRTRLILFRILSSGRLESVEGVAKVGKEASIYRGVGWDPAAHAALAHEASWYTQKVQVWDLGQSTTSDDDHEDEDAEEDEDEDEEQQEEEQDGAVAAGRIAPATATASHTASTAAAPTTAATSTSVAIREMSREDDDDRVAERELRSEEARRVLARLRLDTTTTSSHSHMAAGDADHDAQGHEIIVEPEHGEILDDSAGDGSRQNASRHASTTSTHGPSHGLSDDREVAVKIFKMTLSKFKNRRDYMEGDRRYRTTKLRHQNPRKIVTLWAEREFTNLIRVHRSGIPSPAPYLLRGHVLIMSFIGDDGWPAPQLREVKSRSKTFWSALYVQTVAIMSAMYKWCHLIHADLSEYNLLYWHDRVHVIDLGQAVDASHPRAEEFLLADSRNITNFFSRKGVNVLSIPDLIDLIKDTRVSPHPTAASAIRTGSAAGKVPAPGSGARTYEQDEAKTAAASIADTYRVTMGVNGGISTGTTGEVIHPSAHHTDARATSEPEVTSGGGAAGGGGGGGRGAGAGVGAGASDAAASGEAVEDDGNDGEDVDDAEDGNDDVDAFDPEHSAIARAIRRRLEAQ